MVNTLKRFDSMAKAGRRVLLAIISKYGYTTPSMPDMKLAESLGIPQQTCSIGLRELKKAGFLVEEGYKSYRVILN